MIKLGFIVPIHHLRTFAVLSDYHLVLAHMVRDSEYYTQFYKERSDMGDFITLDNSSYEVGDGVFDEEDLIWFADAVGAKEIMAPETYRDCPSTIDKVRNFVYKIRALSPNMKIFAVAHGKTYAEYLTCINRFIDLGVDTIGLSCRLDEPPTYPNVVFCNRSQEWVRSSVRMNLMVEVATRFANMINPPKIHLLGLNHPCELAFQMRWDNYIRSNDSSAPYLSGLIHQNVNDFAYLKPTNKIDFNDDCDLEEEQYKSITANIHRLKGMCGHWDTDRYMYIKDMVYNK